MIDQRYQKIVFSFFMALLMSSIMSLVISLFNIGFVPNIMSIWLQAWGFAFCVVFPTIILVSPLVHKLVGVVLNKGT